MECRDVREQLNDLLDGQLSPELEEEVRIHLEECADCREEYEVLTLLQKLGGVSEEEPPAELMEGVKSRIWAEKLRGGPKRKRHFQIPFSVVAAAAVFLILVSVNNNGALKRVSNNAVSGQALMPDTRDLPTGTFSELPDTASIPESAGDSDAAAPKDAPQNNRGPASQDAPQEGADEGGGNEKTAGGGEMPPSNTTTDENGASVSKFDEKMGMFRMGNGAEIYDDPLNSTGDSKYGFIVTVDLPPDFDYSDAVKSLTWIATVEDISYYKLSQSQLKGVLKKLSDGVVEELESEKYIDESLDEGILILY